MSIKLHFLMIRFYCYVKSLASPPDPSPNREIEEADDILFREGEVIMRGAEAPLGGTTPLISG
jgi:hypothetical protein